MAKTEQKMTKRNKNHKQKEKQKKRHKTTHFCVILENASENEWKRFYILDSPVWHNQKRFYFFVYSFVVRMMLLLPLLCCCSSKPFNFTTTFDNFIFFLYSAIKDEHFGWHVWTQLLENSSPFSRFLFLMFVLLLWHAPFGVLLFVSQNDRF